VRISASPLPAPGVTADAARTTTSVALDDERRRCSREWPRHASDTRASHPPNSTRAVPAAGGHRGSCRVPCSPHAACASPCRCRSLSRVHVPCDWAWGRNSATPPPTPGLCQPPCSVTDGGHHPAPRGPRRWQHRPPESVTRAYCGLCGAHGHGEPEDTNCPPRARPHTRPLSLALGSSGDRVRPSRQHKEGQGVEVARAYSCATTTTLTVTSTLGWSFMLTM